MHFVILGFPSENYRLAPKPLTANIWGLIWVSLEEPALLQKLLQLVWDVTHQLHGLLETETGQSMHENSIEQISHL